MSRTPAVSVVVCTYNRPLLLEATLRSCLANATRHDLPYEIVIADNSPSGHASAVVAKLLSAEAPIRCVPCHPPNISIARNAGLRAAQAPLVAFLDDDLEVEPGWLDALHATITGTGADGVIGGLVPVFYGGAPPDWDPSASRFTRVCGLPDGAPIAPEGLLRPAGVTFATANSIWRAATCFTDEEPYAPRFGVSGGEDFDLSLRLHRRGRSFAWCAAPPVRETIPLQRQDLRYQLRRAFSGGQVYASVVIHNAPAKFAAALPVMAAGLAQGVVHGLVALACWPAGRFSAAARLVAARQGVAALSGFGKLMWWRLVRLYHTERG